MIVLASCTLFAVAPPRPRHSSPSNRSYWLGYLLNELPFVAFYWLVASTGLALSEGVARSWLGRSALALAAATTVALAVIVRRGLQARRAVDSALDASLGLGWRGTIDPELAGRLRRRLPLARILLLPLRREAQERGARREHQLRRRGPVEPARRVPAPIPPVRLSDIRPPARWCVPQRTQEQRGARLLYRLASQGWLCVSANYRLSPAARFPDHLVDVKKVIAWVRAHGHEYGADPTVLLVAGSSAGGNLAATAALTPNEPRFQPGFEEVDTSVTAAVSLYGYYGPYGGAPAAESSPASYVRADGPPFFIAHGDRDTIVLARTHEASSRPSARLRRIRSCTRSFPAASTASTSSSRCASRASSTGSRRSRPFTDKQSGREFETTKRPGHRACGCGLGAGPQREAKSPRPEPCGRWRAVPRLRHAGVARRCCRARRPHE